MRGIIPSLVRAGMLLAIIVSLISCGRDRSAELTGGARVDHAEPQTIPNYPDTYATDSVAAAPGYPQRSADAEEYGNIQESNFLAASDIPLSTFSIDVDPAAYSNVRRIINEGRLPDPDAVRIEEMINYFDYDYPQPDYGDPFSITTDVASCPWNRDHMLVHIGLKGKELAMDQLPPNNLVFLVDVSGSMADENKLPLLKRALRMMVNELRPEDRVALVVYAGAAGEVLPSTSGANRGRILSAIDRLEAGGSTAGEAGIQLAYSIARENFSGSGNNRVILATDGDFNVGASSDEELVRMIEEKRQSGIFLTVLGFGTGNLKDSKMEQLADKGNGQYAYIDNINEARKVLVDEAGGTLFAIAKDVKIQVEFNPAMVAEYRLIGYENRALAAQDFNNDAKDAGELGAGHTVTALYEIVPAAASHASGRVDPLRYQSSRRHPELYEDRGDAGGEYLTVKLRYKHPKEEESRKIERRVVGSGRDIDQASPNLRFAAAVAEWGMLLRGSRYKSSASFEDVLRLARDARGRDDHGYRSEFISLVEASRLLRREAM